MPRVKLGQSRNTARVRTLRRRSSMLMPIHILSTCKGLWVGLHCIKWKCRRPKASPAIVATIPDAVRIAEMRYALGSANHYEVCAAVLLPARLVVLGAEWALLTVTRGLYAVFGNPQTHHVFLCRCGAKISQSEIVFLAPALVTMPLDREAISGCKLRNSASFCNDSLASWRIPDLL